MTDVLIDTSVWVQHFRGNKHAAPLVKLLQDGLAATHHWIIGELALGNLGARRAIVLNDLSKLRHVSIVSPNETMAMIDAQALSCSGIGWVDAQLLAASLVAQTPLWSLDKNLNAATQRLGMAFDPFHE